MIAHDGVEIYQRSGELVRVVRGLTVGRKTLQRPRRAPLISTAPEHFLFEQLARSALWMKADRSGTLQHVLPPRWIAHVLAARCDYRFPCLEAITESPALLADGSVLDTPGYDEASALL